MLVRRVGLAGVQIYGRYIGTRAIRGFEIPNRESVRTVTKSIVALPKSRPDHGTRIHLPLQPNSPTLPGRSWEKANELTILAWLSDAFPVVK